MRLKSMAAAASIAITSFCPFGAAHASVLGNKHVVIQSITQVWSRGDLPASGRLYAPDFVCHNIIGPEWRGVDGIKDAIRSHRAAFPDWSEHIDDIVAERDRVAVRFTASGTQRGAFAGIPATGRKVTVREVSFYRLKGGKIVEQWGLPDVNGMLAQLRRPD